LFNWPFFQEFVPQKCTFWTLQQQFTGQMPCLLPNQECESTERKSRALTSNRENQTLDLTFHFIITNSWSRTI